MASIDTQQIVNKAWKFAHVLRDTSLKCSDDLPSPDVDVLAQEFKDDLQTTLEQFTTITEKFNTSAPAPTTASSR